MHRSCRIPAKAIVLVTACALQAGLEAQALVLPSGLADVEGSVHSELPLGYRPSRVQCGFSAEASAWSQTRIVRKLSVRADAWSRVTELRFESRIVLSSVGSKPELSSASFEENHGSDRHVFLHRRVISLTSELRSTPPHPFRLEIKGDAPFVWRSPALVIDWSNYRHVSGHPLRIDAEFRRSGSGAHGLAIGFGAACPAQFRIYGEGLNPGELLRVYTVQAPRRDAIYATWISPQRTHVDLGGACRLHAGLAAPGAVLHPAIGPARGTRAQFNWGRTPAQLARTSLYAQVLSIEAELWSWSEGLELRFGSFRPTTIFSFASSVSDGVSRFDPDESAVQGQRLGSAIVFKVE